MLGCSMITIIRNIKEDHNIDIMVGLQQNHQCGLARRTQAIGIWWSILGATLEA